MIAGLLVLCGASLPARAGSPVKFVRDSIERYALLDIRLQDAPTLADYQAVSAALDIATDLNPDDVELWRRLAEAQFSAGQLTRITRTSERIVRLDPDDTVAAMRLINALVGRQQTADARLETYERFLSPAGEGVDPAVRSRLAFDAALLARELGDETRVDDLLDRALELDPSHKTAIAFTMDRRTGPETPPQTSLAWLIRLLYADPLDPVTHRRIAEVLVREGANRQAYRFFATMLAIENATRIPPDPPRELFKSQFVWVGTGAGSVVSQLNSELEYLRRYASVEFNRRAQRLAALAIPDDSGGFNPANVRLPVHYERVRVLAADASENYETARRAVSDYSQTTFQRVQQLLVQAQQLDSEDPRLGRLVAEQFELRLDAQRMRAWTGLELAGLEQELEVLRRQLPPVFADQLTALQAWAELHRGDPARALALTDGQPVDALTTNQQLLRGAAMETLRRNEEAIELFLAAARTASDDFERLWAGARVHRIDPRVDLSGPHRAAVDRLAAQVPSWIDRMATDPNSFLKLAVTLEDERVEPGEGVRLRVGVTNLAPVPLGVGTNSPIGSSAVMVPAFDRGRALLSGQPRMEVTDLSHRLRLEPGEIYETVVTADAGETGWLFDLHPMQRISHRWRLVQGFVLDTRAQVVPGPGALAVESAIIERRPIAESLDAVPTLTELIPIAEGPGLVDALLRTRAIVLGQSPADPSSATPAEELAALWAARFGAETDTVLKAAMVLGLPHGNQSSAFALFDAGARTEAMRVLEAIQSVPAIGSSTGSGPGAQAGDAGERVATGAAPLPAGTAEIAYIGSVLLTRPGPPESELWAAAGAASDRRIVELSEALAARRRAGGAGYAQATDGWSTVIGSSLRLLEGGE